MGRRNYRAKKLIYVIIRSTSFGCYRRNQGLEEKRKKINQKNPKWQNLRKTQFIILIDQALDSLLDLALV